MEQCYATADRSSGINSEVYRVTLSAEVQTNRMAFYSANGLRPKEQPKSFSVTRSQSSRVCFSVTDDKTETHKQAAAASKSGFSKDLAEHFKGGNSIW